MTVWVVIPTHNRRQIVLQCLNDLSKQSYGDMTIIVVDDGSTDGTFEELKRYGSGIKVLKGDGNRWWTGSINIGLAYALSRSSVEDYILTLNDDVLVASDYVENLVAVSRAYGKKVLIGSLAVDSEDTRRVAFCGTGINWSTGRWKGYSAESVDLSNSFIKSDSLPGRGVLIPVNAFSEIGFFDDRVFPQYFADEDFSLRAKKRGYDLVVSTAAIVKSHVRLTGTGRHGQTFSAFFKSLFSMRSPNQIWRRAYFSMRHAPLRYKISFALIDCTKVISAYFRKRGMRC